LASVLESAVRSMTAIEAWSKFVEGEAEEEEEDAIVLLELRESRRSEQ
jgi:hypothetical protein